RRDDAFSSTPFFLFNEKFTKVKVIKAGQIGVTGLFVVPFEGGLLKKKIGTALSIVPEPIILKTKEIFEEGLELIENKEYEKALKIFKSLVTQKDNPEYYFNIGFIKTSQTKYIEAIEAFGMAAKLDRFFARAYEEMGRVYRLIGDSNKAEEYMQQAAEIYLDTDKIGTAEGILNEILDSGSDSMNVFNTLGVLYRKKGESETALQHYKKALKVHPDESYIYYNIGRLYMDMKDTEKAVEYFKQSLEKDPEFEDSKQVIKAIELGII
ncbi:MAG: tetratricopeptide repeat protein, partial [Desulfobulbaceae bacterium]|nr:tetratricopeptide repeat protein [Desulfobulbaceae bacterium]